MKIDLFSIGRFTVHGYGAMIAIGVLLCVYMAFFRARKYHKDPEAMVDIAIYGLIFGFLGAKVMFCIVEFKTFIKDPLSVIGAEGFVVYGGIIGGVLAAMVYSKIKKLHFIEYFDIAVASIALAQGFGRLGCFMAGCCYGKETTSAIGVVFPAGSMAPAGVKLLPTQLFSSAGDFLIMVILLIYYKEERPAGKSGGLYLMLYGVGRFCLEFLRNDDRGGFGPFSTSQWISFGIVALGVWLFFRKPKAAEAVAEAVDEVAADESAEKEE